MYSELILSSLVSLALAQAPPSPVLLTTTKSGVDPILPTPFNGVETIEGAITYDGPPIPGFVGPGGKAVIQSNLPQATYTASLPKTNFDNLTGSVVVGSITGKTASDGRGVVFTVDFTGFPSQADYGPFVYHVHGLPVPANGNCTETLGHLDPTNRGELHACDSSQPDTCQAGDLAGKHGNVTSSALMTTYTELYLSTDPSSPYYFGDKSIVVHSRNTTRLTCANFKKVSSSGSGGSSSTTSTAASTSSPPAYTPGNAAATFDGRLNGALGSLIGLAAYLLL